MSTEPTESRFIMRSFKSKPTDLSRIDVSALGPIVRLDWIDILRATSVENYEADGGSAQA